MDLLVITPIIVFWMFFIMIVIVSIQESTWYKRLKKWFKVRFICRGKHNFVRAYHSNDPIKDKYKCKICGFYENER